MLFKNFVVAASLVTVLTSVSLPTYAAGLTIPLPEDAFAAGAGNQPAGPFTYTGGGSKEALGGAINAAAPFNGSFVTANNDIPGDNSFSYLSQTGATALSASFFVTQQLLTNLTSITLSFNALPTAGTLTAYLYDATNNVQLNSLVVDSIALYGGVSSGDFKSSLAANTAYSIQWIYTGTGVAGFNNAVIQTEAVPEPSEALGLLGFGLVAFGGSLQKKRNLKRAA
jgi:hypothetical protein